jgi:hypothetical protein
LAFRVENIALSLPSLRQTSPVEFVFLFSQNRHDLNIGKSQSLHRQALLRIGL